MRREDHVKCSSTHDLDENQFLRQVLSDFGLSTNSPQLAENCPMPMSTLDPKLSDEMQKADVQRLSVAEHGYHVDEVEGCFCSRV